MARAKKKATKRKASKRRANPDESSLFHVTYAGRLFEIAEEGLASDRRSSIGGESYDWHRRGSIFLSESGGVSYWYHWAAQWAFDRSDEPADDGLVPVVLRIVGGPLTDDLKFLKVCEDDDLGWQDSGQPAYKCKTTIGPKYLQVWTGSSWVPVRDYGEVDLSTSFDIHTWENVLLPNDKEMEAGKKAKRNPIHHSPRHKEEIHVLDSAGWHVILEPSSIEGPDESTINAVKLVDPDNESYYALITRSARDPGQWQATRFDERGPVGHSTKDTLIEAVNDTRKWYGLTVAEVVEKNPRKAKKPHWKLLLDISQHLWETYDDKPLKRNLVNFGVHSMAMKEAKSVKVRAEGARAHRAYKREMKAHGWKEPKITTRTREEFEEDIRKARAKGAKKPAKKKATKAWSASDIKGMQEFHDRKLGAKKKAKKPRRNPPRVSKAKLIAGLNETLDEFRQSEKKLMEESGISYRDPLADTVIREEGRNVMLHFDGAGYDYLSVNSDYESTLRQDVFDKAESLGWEGDDYSCYAMEFFAR